MVDVDPIPLDALVDAITVSERVSATQVTDSGPPAAHRFNHVLVQPADKQQITGGAGSSSRPQITGNYLVLIDRINSINTDKYQIKLGDTVEWDGKPRKVSQVNPMKALLPTPHHWEVWLS